MRDSFRRGNTYFRVAARAKKSKTIALPDAIVAAIAIKRGCTLMTDNRKDFAMPELNLYPLP